MKELVGLYLNEVLEKGEPAMIAILGCVVPRYFLFWEHKRLGLKLEDLSQEEKQEMWEFVFKHFPDRSIVFREDSCRIIQVIGYLLPS